MRNTYDTPGIDRILSEQETEFPHGPLGTLRTPEVVVEPELGQELQALRDWKEGRLGLMELMGRLEALQRKNAVPVLRP